MKTLSDRHLERLQKLVEEKQEFKKTAFILKITKMLESYNCTSMKDLDDESAVKFIQEMINDDIVLMEEESDDAEDITNKEYLKNVIDTETDPEKVQKAVDMLADLDDYCAEELQYGSHFFIMKPNMCAEPLEVVQKRFDKECGVFCGTLTPESYAKVKDKMSTDNANIEYTADEVVNPPEKAVETNESTNQILDMSKETATKLFDYHTLTGLLPEGITEEDYNSVMMKHDIKTS